MNNSLHIVEFIVIHSKFHMLLVVCETRTVRGGDLTELETGVCVTHQDQHSHSDESQVLFWDRRVLP